MEGDPQAPTTAPDAAQDPAPPAVRLLPFEFRGDGAEYFRIWIVNLLLTIVTLGIYSAWAKVRRLRYFYGNTRLDGHAFDYHGSPVAILKGRLIAFGLYVVYAVVAQTHPEASLPVIIPLLAALPWVVMRSRKFHMRMSSWRGLRFDFHGDYGGAFKAYVGWLFAAVFTLYILFPVYLYKRISYVLGNSAYGSQAFRFVTPSGRFWGFGLAIVGMGFALFIGWMLSVGLLTALSSDRGGDGAGPGAAAAGLVSLVALVLIGLALTAFYSKSVANAGIGGIEIGPHRLQSTLRTAPLFGLYLKNFLLIVVTLGAYYPWAKVATVRYQLENTALETQGDLDDFRASADDGGTATGEEISDFFDVDFGL
jgi:uncharacterized membrane protein YjgN (DUF898 family)